MTRRTKSHASEQADWKLLRDIPLFRALSKAQLAALVATSFRMRIPARQALFEKGDDGAHLYAVTQGRLKVVSQAEDERELIFAMLDRGEVFGEVAVFDREPRSLAVVAVEDSSLLVIHRRDFLASAQSNPALLLGAMELLCQRLRRVSSLAEDALFLTIPSRLAKRILALAQLYGSSTREGIHIDLKLTQQELAELVGATRESVNKQLRQWTQEGVLRVQDGEITILARAGLAAAASRVRL